MHPSIKIINPNDITEKEVIIQHMKKTRIISHLNYIPEALKNDKDIFRVAVTVYQGGLSYASEELKNDRAFCLELLDIEPMAFYGFNDKLKDDLEIIQKSLSLAKDKVVTIHKLKDITSPRIANLFKGETFIKKIEEKLLKAIEMEQNGYRINEDDFSKQVETYELLLSLNKTDNKNTAKKIKV